MLPFTDSDEFFSRGEETTPSDFPVSSDVALFLGVLEDRERRRVRFTRFVGGLIASLSAGTALAVALHGRFQAPETATSLASLGRLALATSLASIPSLATAASPVEPPPVVEMALSISAEKRAEPARAQTKPRRAVPARAPTAMRPVRSRTSSAPAPQRDPLDRPPPTARFAD